MILFLNRLSKNRRVLDSSVELFQIAVKQTTHFTRESVSVCEFKEQMIMIRHQTIGVESTALFKSGFPPQLEKQAVIRVSIKKLNVIIDAIIDMIAKAIQ